MKYNTKYTKWIVLFGIALIVFFTIASILYNANAGPYEAFEVEWLDVYQDPAAPEQATVTFNGVTYTGTYQETKDLWSLPYIRHTYRGDGFEFEINGETGQLSEFSNRLPDNGTAVVDKSYCRQLADSIVDDYFDLDEYLVEEKYHDLGENDLITYTYYKKFNGYRSVDRFWIRLNGNGEVDYFTMYGGGYLADVKSISVNKRKVKEAIREKMEEIYAGTTIPVDEFTMSDGLLVKLEDGSCALYYQVGLPEREAIELAVKVNYKKK